MRIKQAGLKNSGAGSLEDLIAQSEAALRNGDHKSAFDLVQKAKALRQPRQGLDLLRANCFLRMGQPGDARESLAEELRWFPGNREAAVLLEELRLRHPEHFASGIQDPEFKPILDSIRKYSMVPEMRLFSLYQLAKQVCLQNIPGNFVECGVAAGGSSAMLAHVIRKFSRLPREHFAFDSFEGMPIPGKHDTHRGQDAESTGWGTGTCAAPEASLMEIAGKLGVSDLVHPVKGFFNATLPRTRDRIGPIGFLHMDGDWYDSTMDILNNLFSQVVEGGVIQVDDYGHWDGCRKALHEYEATHGLKFDLRPIDGEGVFFQKLPRA
jgi:hypothetical protein